jgi:hypothetical protein
MFASIAACVVAYAVCVECWIEPLVCCLAVTLDHHSVCCLAVALDAEELVPPKLLALDSYDLMSAVARYISVRVVTVVTLDDLTAPKIVLILLI